MAESSPDPAVSVLIVTHNGADLLRRCLDALSRQTFAAFEVVVVDNGSRDPVGPIVEAFPGLRSRVFELGRNAGFAAANNRGAAEARGEWLALLNTDAFAEPAWLASLMERTGSRPEFTFFSSLQLSDDDPSIVDGTGDLYALNGRAWRRDHRRPAAASHNEEEEVFGACAAAALYRKAAFDEVGGFDESYFCYSEDVDLAFRLRLKGYRCLYVPAAVVRHIGSATAGGDRTEFAIYHGFRNSEWTFFKNMPWPLVLTELPAHLWLVVNELRYARSIGKLGAALRAKWDAVRGLGTLRPSRDRVQRDRRIGVDELRRVMEPR